MLENGEKTEKSASSAQEICADGQVSRLRGRLIGALVGLVRAADGGTPPPESTYQVLMEGLCMTGAGDEGDAALLREQIGRTHAEKEKLAPDCAVCGAPCGRTADYDMADFWKADEDVRALKTLILSGLREIAAWARRASKEGRAAGEASLFLFEGLFLIGYQEDAESLWETARKTGRICLACREADFSHETG